MRVSSLRLINFRNYEDSSFSFSENIIVLHGLNGVGKTNILEGIYTSTVGKSHRTSEDGDMIRFGAQEGSITLTFEKNEVEHKLFIKLPIQGRKIITLNENKLSQKELVGTLNTVLFSPEDLQLIKGAPKMRRHFLDLELSQTSKSYYQQLLLYNRALLQRNRLLKEYFGRSEIPLEEWDIQLASAAAFITQKRLKSLEKINMLANLMHRRLTGGKENLKLSYEQPYNTENHITSKEDFYDLIKKSENQDRMRMTTSVGPHRDDIIFYNDKGNLKKFGSQGQQRTAVLAIKLSELEFIKSEVGEYPILLLDDVLSELDEERRQNLISFIHRRVQTFITATENYDFKNIKDVQYVDIIKSGAIVT